MRHEKIDMFYKAAIEVFSESGFDQAKMDEIAQAAGVAKGTIYYHFKSKEELFVGLMNEGIEKLIDYVKRVVETYSSPVEQLKALIEAQVVFFIENRKLARLILNEAFGSRERQIQFRKEIRKYLLFIEELLKQGIEAGAFTLTRTAEAASAIFGAISVLVLQKICVYEDLAIENAEKEIPEITKILCQMIFQGFLNKSSSK
jgi:AcrR family transcriptional regulator